MKYGIITVPSAPVRKKSDHREEMINQLLFGEAVEIIKRKNETWLKVKNLADGYTGWITHHLVTITEIKNIEFNHAPLAAGIINVIKVNNASMHIPMGSVLFGYNQHEGGFDTFRYQFKGKYLQPDTIENKRKAIRRFAKKWLNAPYLWGGKTIMGVDCSGFAQTIYKMAGISIPRDAWQQAEKGTLVSLTRAKSGDLAFFDDKDEIVHVGILLNNHTIIHSAGKVRIDPIDEKGIVHSDTGKRTHRLSIVKTYL